LLFALTMTLVPTVAGLGQQPPPASSACEHERAGYPLATSHLARPSDNGGNVGYLVGGGCPFPHRAEAPTPAEGTWGWDYQGWWLPRRVILGWWHGRRSQGGTGAYRTDGPKVIHPLEGEPPH
jgi:hypothetical protein